MEHRPTTLFDLIVSIGMPIHEILLNPPSKTLTY